MTETMYNNIEAERARKGWTVAELAEKMNISEKTYRNWKDKGHKLDCVELLSLADIFDCTVDYLIGRSNTIRA